MRFLMMLLLLATVAVTSGVHATVCMVHVHNTLPHSSILLCGRNEGGMPGAWYTKLLQPGERFKYNCPDDTATSSYETYYSIRNDTTCTWDTCPVMTGTCKSYPWVIGEGVSAQDGYWYGYVTANRDGNGLGFTGAYNGAAVSFGLKMTCAQMNVNTTFWKGTCDVNPSSGAPQCSPGVIVDGKPSTPVVACGPPHVPGDVETEINVVIVNSP